MAAIADFGQSPIRHYIKLYKAFAQLGEAFFFLVFQPTIHLKGLVIILKTTYNLDEMHSLTLLLMGLLEMFPQVGEAFFHIFLTWKRSYKNANCYKLEALCTKINGFS